MKKHILLSAVALACTLAVVSPGQAATNLLTNGSFESGFSGWTLTGTATDGYPAVVIPYNSGAGYPNGAFNEPVPPPTGSLSPDAAGTHGAYFVSDFANEALTQTVTLNPGKYNIGISVYAPLNGWKNAGDATISASIGGVTLLSSGVHSLNAKNWYDLTGTLVVSAAGPYTAAFNFQTNRFPSADAVIDQAYVVAAPEVSTWAMMLAGFAALGFTGYRRNRTVAALDA
ncbi:hypothetical protein [uncultured Rhodoblastus sp.]|uniref:hypothetical protein n=1 Tax=uncultured Rhodoblastus sp. TaxID=543037 RepID=UPI0025ECF5E5|nr:hypothetical protein [uncultured Rhodoblastus sp.]